MREISRALQTALAGSSDWKQTLSIRLEKLKTMMENPKCAPNALEVARFFEHCVPDREGAIAGYVLCYRADSRRLDALARARAICIEVGDFATTARLSRLQYKNDPDPLHLANEGIAWLDAGQPDRAVKPLMKAARMLPESNDIQSALRTARREWPSVRHEVARLMQKAAEAETYGAASDSVLQAARMLRMLQTNQVSLEKLLLAALDHDPENASALGLLEQMLSHLEDKEALLEVYERRLEARTEPRERVEELRRAGTVVCRQPLYRALGVRLIHRALQIAYTQQLADIPGHLAMLVILRQHYEQAGDGGKLLPIIVKALDGPLPEVDLQYLALMGLDIALNVVDDEESARTFAGLAVGSGAAMHPTVVQARERNLVGEAALSLPAAMPVSAMTANDDSDAVLLDSLVLDAPPPLIGKQESLSARLATAENQGGELPGSLDLEPLPESTPLQSLPSSESAKALELEVPPPQPPAPLEALEFDPAGDNALDLVELPEDRGDALDLVELPEDRGDALDLVEPTQAGDDPLDLVELPEDRGDALDMELPETGGDALDFVELPEDRGDALDMELPETGGDALDLVELPETGGDALDLVELPEDGANMLEVVELPEDSGDALDELPEASDALDLELPEAGSPLDLVEIQEFPLDEEDSTTFVGMPELTVESLDSVDPIGSSPQDALDLVDLPQAPAVAAESDLPPAPTKTALPPPIAKPKIPPTPVPRPMFPATPESGAKPQPPIARPKTPPIPTTPPEPMFPVTPKAAPKPPLPKIPKAAPSPEPLPIAKPKLPAIPKAEPKPPTAKPKLPAMPKATLKPPTAKRKPAKAPKAQKSKGAPPAAKGAPPTATLGKIALIPRSAMSALKQAGVERSKSPPKSTQRAPRLVMPISIEFTLEDQSCSALTRELSETGAFLITTTKIKPAQSLDLAVQMPISCDSMRSETMFIKARVIHATDTGYGVAFDKPSEEFKTRLHELISQQ